MISVNNLSKTFTLYQQGGITLSVLNNISFSVEQGECMILTGCSGSGKSTLLRSLYGNYLPDSGSINISFQLNGQTEVVDLVSADPRVMVYLRCHVIGWVSQFLRIMPRVSTLDLVKQPAIDNGSSDCAATNKAKELLSRLNIPQSLWSLAPATFSGGEQQRVNIARSFMVPYPILLLDEPTASLDKTNREIVLALITEAKTRGAAVIGIFHDLDARACIANREYDVVSAQIVN